ncbi:hypothetical protein LTR37_006165 [Vermiconidia calcicola]|uniref:Uncharacterized protein n=1 Tax=Vermiconidia calcicola TaxID=1690605 RepID=A0ACC3NIR1_9PEZI|nr:hypothetical protein LTR37_006165 [Vermiconidia calcicola]
MSDRHPIHRHESFDELEQRSRSPASQKPKFPLLKLPLELRQQILKYLLPHTKEFRDSGSLGEHARNFSAVKKREAKGMIIPNGGNPSPAGISNVVWQRGNINILSVYIKWRFRWLLPSGMAPSRHFKFLELMPEKYMRLIKRVVVHIDHVDSYTGMIKFNVGGKGLTHGLRLRVQLLVNALRGGSGGHEDKRLTRVNIKVSNGNAVLDQLKSDIVRQREGGIKVAEDLEEMLEPFEDLRGVREVSIGGAVTEQFADKLAVKMRSEKGPDEMSSSKLMDEGLSVLNTDFVRVCVYGNDLE